MPKLVDEPPRIVGDPRLSRLLKESRYDRKFGDCYFELNVNGKKALYNPLNSALCILSKEQHARLSAKSPPSGLYKKLLEGGIFANTYSVAKEDDGTLGIFLTSDCNLRCTYCYAAAGDSKKDIDVDIAKKAIDTKVGQLQRGKLMIDFHGGGEPTLRFDIMKMLMEYARESTETEASLTTNAVFGSAATGWIAENIDKISISCDGPPDIQDRQRPMAGGGKSSGQVEATMRLLNERSKEFGVRATITSFSAGRQSEIVEYFSGLGVNELQFEPVYVRGRCTDSLDLNAFEDNFLAALEVADSYGISLCSTYLPAMPEMSGRFCGACGRNFCVTQDGLVSSCHGVTSGSGDGGSFIYGGYDKGTGQFLIDTGKKRDLEGRTADNMNACKACRLRWNCRGQCPLKTEVMTGDKYRVAQEHCRIIHRTFERFLGYVVRKHFVRIEPYMHSKGGSLYLKGYFTDRPVHLVGEEKKQCPGSVAAFTFNREDMEKKSELLKSLLREKRRPFFLKPLLHCISAKLHKKDTEGLKAPRSCFECIELFTVREDGRVRFCNGEAGLAFAEYGDRSQLFGHFKKTVSETPACASCIYKLRHLCESKPCMR